jgi:hypothetical protein
VVVSNFATEQISGGGDRISGSTDPISGSADPISVGAGQLRTSCVGHLLGLGCENNCPLRAPSQPLG